MRYKARLLSSFRQYNAQQDNFILSTGSLGCYVNWPPKRDSKADVSSVSPSSERRPKQFQLVCQAGRSLMSPSDWTKFGARLATNKVHDCTITCQVTVSYIEISPLYCKDKCARSIYLL